VAKLVARPLATAALWVRIQTSLKNAKLATQRSGQNTLARQKNLQKKLKLLTDPMLLFSKKSVAVDPDPDWIRIQEGENGTQK
jgi:hypothetical protein